MKVRALVPMKPVADAKSRLAPRLQPRCRRLLSMAMLAAVLRAARSTAGIVQVVVVGGDAPVAGVAASLGARWTPDPAPPGDLNGALAYAFRASNRDGMDAALFLPGDLPLLEGRDLADLLARSRGAGLAVVAPDRHGLGTNALLVPAGLSLEPMLGPGSFHSHLEQARRTGWGPAVCRSPGLLLDVDTPEDLDLLLARRPGWWGQALESLAPEGQDGPCIEAVDRGG